MRIFAVLAAVAVGAAMIVLPGHGAFAQATKTDQLSPAATTATPDASAPKTAKRKSSKTKRAAKSSGGRQAATERQRACGAEWKADKAAGKVAAGMTWPKYWSACNTRKKAAGT